MKGMNAKERAIKRAIERTRQRGTSVTIDLGPDPYLEPEVKTGEPAEPGEICRTCGRFQFDPGHEEIPSIPGAGHRFVRVA